MLDAKYDTANALLNLKYNIIVLFYIPDDTLCARAKESLNLYSPKYLLRGYYSLALNVNDYTALYPKLACVHVPKLCVFYNGEVKKEIIGIPTSRELDLLVR